MAPKLFARIQKPRFAWLPLLLLLTSCGGPPTNKDIAAQAVEKFHSQLNEGSYELICLEADMEFRGSNENVAIAYLEKVTELLGKARQSDAVTADSMNRGDEAIVTLVFMTHFDQGRAPETFTYRVKNKEAKLIYYEVGAEGLTKN